MTSPAPKPSNEAARLQQLHDYEILDTPAEKGFDDIVTIAAQICEVPIALVSLVDEERQWFKSKIGLDADETNREVAFCSHAILEPEQVFEVPDANKDPRFERNPLVTGDPDIAFYAGAPLVTDGGDALGTLCVIDQKPRKLRPDQAKSLQALARQVVAQMELRRSLRETQRLNEDLNNFAYIAAHDLRSPLRGIDQLAGFVLEDCADIIPQASQDDLQKLRSRSKRLDEMLQGLLKFSRLGYDNAPRIRISPAAALRRIADAVLPVGFDLQVVDQLPTVYAAESGFELVFRNLFDNAVKHSGASEGSIAINAREAKDYLHIIVSDDGPGIPASQFEKAFQLFSTLQARDRVEGSGMGLAIVKRAIEASGGAVCLEQAPSGGLAVNTKWPMFQTTPLD